MRHIVIAAAALAAPSLAHAQSIAVGVEAATDERRRGLSWSGGDAAVSADAAASLAGFDVSARVVSTRGSARHGGADAVVDIDVARGFDIGAVTLKARAIGHLFAGAAGRQDYVEVGALGSYSLGPLGIDAGATFAPDQAAIGGSNLYLFADAQAGIPATPITLSAGIGRSSGTVDDPLRAARLRPGGSYTDWRLGVAWIAGPLTVGVDYAGNDIDARAPASPLADVANAGDRVVGRVRFAF
jgi:hypothetical protein